MASAAKVEKEIKQIMSGRKIVILLALALLVVGVIFGGKPFFAFGVGGDLSDYRDAIRATDIYTVTKNHLLEDLEKIRLSLDEGNNFGFFQWLEIDDSMKGILKDGKIEANELDSLLAEIERMKKIQGIASQR